MTLYMLVGKLVARHYRVFCS